MLIELKKNVQMESEMFDTLLFFNLILLKAVTLNDSQIENEKIIEKIINEIKNENPKKFGELHFFKEKSLWTKNRIMKFHDALKTIEERKTFVECALHDIKYHILQDDRNFQFKAFNYLQTFEEKTIKSVTKIFKDLYSAFFEQKIPIDSDKSITMREHYLSLFFEDNDNIMICPSCLGELNVRTLQLDHYFPQSKFPVLSIHPVNLVPICSTCNTSMGNKKNTGKGEKIPIDFTLPEHVESTLNKIYLPYISSASKKIIGKIEINDDLRNKSLTPHLLNDCELEKERLNAFCDLFNIKNNWTSKIPFIHMNIMTKAKIYFQIMIETQNQDIERKLRIDNQLTIMTIKEYLFRTYIMNHDNYVLKLPDVLITSSYVMWLLRCEESLKALIEELKLTLLQERKMEAPYFYNPNIYS